MGNATPKASIRLLIVDDQIVVRAGFSSVLRSCHAGLNVVGSESSGEQALKFLERYPVDVLLLDLRMPGMSGIETLLASQKLPHPPRVIILSSFEPDDEICRAVELGAKGYLRKDTSCVDIVEAVHAVHAGNSYFPPWIGARISERKLGSSLSPRELEILEMVAKGLTNKEIGRTIQVSHFTVRNHVANIIAKLDVGDRTEASTVAIQQGILMAQDVYHDNEASAKAEPIPTTQPISWLKPRVIPADRSREKQSKLVRGDRRVSGTVRSALEIH
jgi:two-component system, NarL family, response regulator